MAAPHHLLLGRFVSTGSALERLDPRTKLLASALLLAALLLPRSPLPFLPAAALFGIALASSRLRPALVLGSLQGLGWLLLVTLVFQVAFLPGDGEPLVALGPVPVTEEALVRGLSVSAALALSLLVATLLSLSTSPVEIADAARAALRPLRRVGVPVDDLALVAMIALRFVPTLVEEAERIQKAQRARGLRPARGPLARARTIVPLLAPLVEGVVRKADDLAVALEARGYEPGAERVPYRDLRFRARDAAALALAAAAAAATAGLAITERGR